MPRVPADRRSFPPEAQLHVISVASSDPAEQGCSATRWSLDDIAQDIVNQAHHGAISRSTIWRTLEDADLKPHKSVCWLNSHAPDFNAKAEQICQPYVNAPKLYQQGQLVICCDEKTGMQILERKHATQQAEPRKPRRRDEYTRHGTRALIASFAVPTREVAWTLGTTRTSRRLRRPSSPRRRSRPPNGPLPLGRRQPQHALELAGLQELIAEWCDIPLDQETLRRGKGRRAFLGDPTHMLYPPWPYRRKEVA